MDLFKVFICEDESIVREGLRDMIPWEKYGFEFVGDAPDGEMALPMIRKLKPDVLITDITMPFMDGLSLSKTVTKELPNIKIIVISGYSDFEYARKAIEIGVEQYLLKPVTKTDMINALEGVRKKITEVRASFAQSIFREARRGIFVSPGDLRGSRQAPLKPLGRRI